MIATLFAEIRAILYKEMRIEWKQKYAINGLLLYVLGIVVVVSLAFEGKAKTPQAWNIMFWIVILFAAINTIAKSFIGERNSNLLYLYTLAHPMSVILAKMLYNSLLLMLIATLALLLSMLLGGIMPQNFGLFFGALLLGCAALATNLTLISAIAARAENKQTLLAVLSFPVIVPVLLSLIRITFKALDGFGWNEVQSSILLVGGITLVLAVVSTILFPVVWRE